MRIKRLDILGFKSFVDKVSLDFQAGITSIVGPNGCGKSNIVDAIRWVMGEQSVKNLRGRQMEDIIFAGSESRKPLGMAEVSLIFSTDDGRVPAKYLNFSEIQVTRRLFRDGDSEYFINKTPCRLLDIAELFMDTGVGAKAYSIIEQGKIGMILLAKPEERRFLIEEAAGVTKFKSRKQVALRKIEVTRQNLIRLGDIIAEIRRQLNSLQRQAKKAEKFKAWREELKEIELLFATHQYISTNEIREQVDTERKSLVQRATELATELAQADLAIEARRINLLEEEKRLAAAQEDIFKAKGDLQAAENRLEFQQREFNNLQRHLARIKEDLASLEQQLLESESELTSLNDRKGLFATELQDEEGGLQQREAELEGLLATEAGLVRQLEEIRHELFTALSEISRCGNQQVNAGKRLDALLGKITREQRESEVMSEKHAETSSRITEFEKACIQLVADQASLADQLTILQQQDENLKIRIQEIEAAQQSQRDLLSRKESRLHSLQELEKQFAGYGQGVRALMLSEQFQGRFAGVVADLLETGVEYESLVEVALGEKLQYLVGDSTSNAMEAIAYLKETGAGRSSFLMRDTPVESNIHQYCTTDKLLDKITVCDNWRMVVEPLLADIYLASDLSRACDLAQQHPYLKFVTPEGDMVESGGIISGGAPDGGAPGLIHSKREIRELSLEVTAIEAIVLEQERDRETLRGQIAELETAQREARQVMHQTELQLVNLQKDLQQAGDELLRLDERIAIIGMEADQSREERDSLETELATLASQEAAAIKLRQVLEERSIGLQGRLEEQRRLIEVARELVTTMKVRAAALNEKRDSNMKAIVRVEELVQQLRRKIAEHGLDLHKTVEDQEAMQIAIVHGETEIKGLLAHQAISEQKYVEVKEQYEVSLMTIQNMESGLKGMRVLHDEVRLQEADLNLRNSELIMQLRQIESSLRDRYRLDIAVIIPEYKETAIDELAQNARQDELHRLIDEIGDVNLMAIEEYQELDGRYQFLCSQRDDLEESLRSLQKAIQRINSTTRKRFLETFQLVNAKFQEVFPRLFCGGSATLRLTDEENLLETGIEIIVQPPGKKLQSVSLLSGGEKALTAVALIFSIFLIKPSPFCLLDEVDAPLDDANIGRFNEMVREMTSFSQFIIITHNKVTMGVADILYGVTMEEPGVSKLVSVKLNV